MRIYRASLNNKPHLVITIATGVVAVICLIGWITSHHASHAKIKQLSYQLEQVQFDLETANNDNIKLEGQLAESNRLLHERQSLREKQEAQARVRELNAEMNMLHEQIKVCKSRIDEASKFHLFRTNKERTAELDKLGQELNSYVNRAIEVEAELARLETSSEL